MRRWSLPMAASISRMFRSIRGRSTRCPESCEPPLRPSQHFEASFPLRTGEADVANRLRRRIYPPRYAPPEAGGREASFRSLVLRHRKRGSRRTLLAPPPQSAPHPPTPRRPPDESLHPPRFRTSRARPRAFPTNRAKLRGSAPAGIPSPALWCAIGRR